MRLVDEDSGHSPTPTPVARCPNGQLADRPCLRQWSYGQAKRLYCDVRGSRGDSLSAWFARHALEPSAGPDCP